LSLFTFSVLPGYVFCTVRQHKNTHSKRNYLILQLFMGISFQIITEKGISQSNNLRFHEI